MKKYRIGIIGTENSHADAFASFFNKSDEKGEPIYPDCHVTLVYGHYPEANERVVRECGADAIASSIDEMVHSVDAVMITARDGKFHAEFARPFIEAGIPVFIDKPFTTDVQEALMLVRLAKEKGVPLCGGSSLKYAEDIAALKASARESTPLGGFVAAPLDFQSIYSGFWFYSAHLAEMCLETFGWQPKRVYAQEKNNSVQAIVDYEDFSVNCSFVNGCGSSYTGIVFGTKGTERKAVRLDNVFRRECDVFVETVRSGKMAHTYEQLVAPVRLLAAIEESYQTGRTVEITYEAI